MPGWRHAGGHPFTRATRHTQTQSTRHRRRARRKDTPSPALHVTDTVDTFQTHGHISVATRRVWRLLRSCAVRWGAHQLYRTRPHFSGSRTRLEAFALLRSEVVRWGAQVATPTPFNPSDSGCARSLDRNRSRAAARQSVSQHLTLGGELQAGGYVHIVKHRCECSGEAIGYLRPRGKRGQTKVAQG